MCKVLTRLLFHHLVTQQNCYGSVDFVSKDVFLSELFVLDCIVTFYAIMFLYQNPVTICNLSFNQIKMEEREGLAREKSLKTSFTGQGVSLTVPTQSLINCLNTTPFLSRALWLG